MKRKKNATGDSNEKEQNVRVIPNGQTKTEGGFLLIMREVQSEKKYF